MSDDTLGQEPKRCLFCGGGGPFNDEHPFGAWTWKHIADLGVDYDIEKGVKEMGQTRSATKSNNRSFNIWTRQVCVSCNGGWMKQLQERVQLPLTSMVRGGRGLLGPQGQRLLARWAVTAVMARDSADQPEDRKVNADLPRSLCKRHGAPSPRTLIWCGRYIGRHVHRYHCESLYPIVREGMSLSPDGFAATFTLGEALFQVVHGNDNEDVEAVRRSAARLPLNAIWPPGSDSVEWPPAQLFTDDTFSSLVSVHMLRAF